MSAATSGLTLALTLGCQRVPDEVLTATAGDESTSSSTSDGSTSTTSAGGSTGSVLPEYLCDPADITSCPDGEKCTALLRGGYQNHYECVTDDTAHGLFDPCAPSPLDGQDGCPPSTYCGANDYDKATGLCVPLCKKDFDCAGACLTNAFDTVPYCGDACDPTQPACPQGLQCRRGPSSFACSFYSVDLDIGEFGAQCYPENDIGCREGFVCLPGALVPECETPTDYCCSHVCDKDLGDNCVSPSSCHDLFTDPSPGYEWVGACYIPA